MPPCPLVMHATHMLLKAVCLQHESMLMRQLQAMCKPLSAWYIDLAEPYCICRPPYSVMCSDRAGHACDAAQVRSICLSRPLDTCMDLKQNVRSAMYVA